MELNHLKCQSLIRTFMLLKYLFILWANINYAFENRHSWSKSITYLSEVLFFNNVLFLSKFNISEGFDLDFIDRCLLGLLTKLLLPKDTIFRVYFISPIYYQCLTLCFQRENCSDPFLVLAMVIGWIFPQLTTCRHYPSFVCKPWGPFHNEVRLCPHGLIDFNRVRFSFLFERY